MSGVRGFLTSRPILFLPSLINTFLSINTTATIPSTWIPNGASGAFICCDTLGGGVKLMFGTAAGTNWGLDIGPGQHFEIRDNPDLLTKMNFASISGTAGKISFIFFTE